MRRFLILGMLIMLLWTSGCSNKAVPTGDWLSVDSEHFRYLFLEENGIPTLTAVQELEQFYALVGPQWDFPADLKVNYYKFASNEQRKELAGRSGNGEAFVDRLEVQTIWDADFHEVAHVYTIHYANRNGKQLETPFWSEGIAMYYSWPSMENRVGYWSGKTVHQTSKDIMAVGNMPTIAGLVHGWREFRSLEAEISYPVSGSFVTYLIDTFGFDTFKNFFGQVPECSSRQEILGLFMDSYGMAFEEVAQDWEVFIKAL